MSDGGVAVQGSLSCLTQCPVLLVWLVGVVLAIVHWRHHPRVSLLTVIGLAVLTVMTVVSVFLGTWLPRWLFESGRMSVNELGNVMAVVRVVESLISAGAFGLILAAIFSGRRQLS